MKCIATGVTASHGSEPKRSYRMRARGEAAEETRRRILSAMISLYQERWVDQLALEEVAARAGVTVQTVLRRFGNKEHLIAAAGEELERHVMQQRSETPVGDVGGAVSNLFDHYEEMGDLVLRSLAQEGRYAPIRALTDRGRQLHYGWVARTFAPKLQGASGEELERLRAQLIAITDVYVWKLLRRDLGLERGQAELALREMIGGLLGTPGSRPAEGGAHGHD